MPGEEVVMTLVNLLYLSVGIIGLNAVLLTLIATLLVIGLMRGK